MELLSNSGSSTIYKLHNVFKKNLMILIYCLFSAFGPEMKIFLIFPKMIVLTAISLDSGFAHGLDLCHKIHQL